MPTGYGGQLVALDVEPFDLANPLAAAAKIQQERNAAKADLPGAQAGEQNALAAEANARTATATAALPGVVAESSLKADQSALSRAATGNALIADAWSKIDADDADATDKMHAAMQKLVDQGVDQAKQFLKVPFTQARASAVVGAFGAKTPQEGAAATASGGLPSDEATPQQIAEWDGRTAGMAPAQLHSSLATLEATKAALIRVRKSANPSQAWDREAAALGHPDWVGRYSALTWQGAWEQTAPLDKYLRGRLSDSGAGLAAPPTPSEVKEANGGIYAVTPYGPGGKPTATALTPAGQWILTGTDPTTGEGIYHNSVTNEERKGSMALGQKPGTFGAGAGGAFEMRRTAYLQVHPGDEQGALEYARTGANGPMGKQMGPAQIQLASMSQARAEYNAMVNAGQPPPQNEEAWETQRASEIAAQLNAAQNDLGGGGGGGGAQPNIGRPGGVEADATQRATVASNWETVNGQLQRYAGTGDKAWMARVKADQARVEEAALAMPPMANPGPRPPPRALALLKEGRLTRFDGGQAWTLRGGTPVRLW